MRALAPSSEGAPCVSWTRSRVATLQLLPKGDRSRLIRSPPAGAQLDFPQGAALSPSVPVASPPNPDSRRLVLGAAIGFDVEQVRIFVESLRAHYKGDVLMLIRWPGLRVARYLKSRRIDVIRVFQTRSFTRSVHARRYA